MTMHGMPAALLAGFLVAAGVRTALAEEQEPPCSAPESSQLDFWVGTWEVTWDGGSGTNTVERSYDGCVVIERFEGGKFRGMSVSSWNPGRGVWEQTWVDNAGNYMDFTGGIRGDAVVFSRAQRGADGDVHQRMTFRDITDDAFIWDWETSSDGGETWKMAWQIRYRRKA